MRRTRWDQAPDENNSLPSGSSWSHLDNQTPIDWEHKNKASENERVTVQVATPHPLDYSKPSQSNEINKNSTATESPQENEITGNTSKPPLNEVSPIIQHPWSFFPNHQHIYPSSNSQIGYQSQMPWTQSRENFYPNSSYHDPNIFDIKWWNDKVDDSDKSLQSSGYCQFNSKFGKSNERISSSDFDINRRFGRYQSVYDRSCKMYHDQKQYVQSGNNRYNNKHDSLCSKFFRNSNTGNSREIQDNSRATTHNSYSWTNPNYGYSNNCDRKKYRPTYFNFKPFDDNHEKKFKPNKGTFKNYKNIGKIERKKDSAAETAKKRALAVAANRLKMTFLAGKNKFKKSSIKKIKLGGRSEKSSSKAKQLNLKKFNKFASKCDISRPISLKSNSFEVKSADQVEYQERGVPVISDFIDIHNIDSDSGSIQSVTELDKKNSDIESVEMELSDYEEGIVDWSDENYHAHMPGYRKRHASESYGSEIVSQMSSKPKRVRSYSTSHMDDCSSRKLSKNNISSVPSNIKNLFVKQLLTMDKKSIKELVNNPKSRKAQFMMNHFMKMQRVAVSQKLNQFRFKNKFSGNCNDNDLQSLETMTPAQLESLPPDIIQQVKEILAFEECGKVEQIWEEVSLSLYDLMSGMSESSAKDEQFLGLDSNSEREKSLVLEDLEIQIMTPPPKTPATTITIPDSDTEHAQASSNKSSNDSPSQEEEISCQFLKPNLPPQGVRHFNSVSSSPSLTHFPNRALSNRITSIEPSLIPSHRVLSPILHTSGPPWMPSAPSLTPSLCNLQKDALSDKNKTIGSSQLLHNDQYDLEPAEAHSIRKVKQERPLSMMECGLCLHPPRSPHSSQCGFAFGISHSPSALMHCSTKLLRNTPHQPVPQMQSSTLTRIFKQEKTGGTVI